MKYRYLINESTVTVFHGNRHDNRKLDSKFMLNSEMGKGNAEGIGIYFTSRLETAEVYGKYLFTAQLNTKRFLESRDNVKKLGTQRVAKLLKALNRYDREAMFYALSDWVYVTEPSEVVGSMFDDFAQAIANDEIRNFQISMAQLVGVENFVKEWNKIMPFDGLVHQVNKTETHYVVINPKIKMQSL